MPAFAQGEIWAQHGIGVAPAMRDRLKRQLDVNVKAMAAAKARGIRLLGTDSGNAAVMTPGSMARLRGGIFRRASRLHAAGGDRSANAGECAGDGPSGQARHLGVLGSARPALKLLIEKVAPKTDTTRWDRLTEERRA
jgi:hypothetical protein